jgi:hypothetical protein
MCTVQDAILFNVIVLMPWLAYVGKQQQQQQRKEQRQQQQQQQQF